ncbi:MAG: endonuclease NucS [Pseudorhodobacter sp.]|nr:endonuclease NucS [Pseudorhodobacter sp.]
MAMRADYKDWLKAEGYADNTCNAQIARVQRIESTYGPIEDIVERGGYDALFAELSYSTADERHNRPNPSKFKIEGNIRNNLASYKNALARYARFLGAPPVEAVETLAQTPAETPEKQRLSLERDMQTALRENLSRLEPGLSVIDDGAERAVATGFIDILARDAAGAVVVIELKAGKTDARVIGQVLGYMGDIAAEDEPDALRGIIVAHEFDPRTRSAVRAVPNLRLMRYAVLFSFAAED